MLFAVIPSPSSNAFELGPLTLHAYGICIALGVIAGTWLAGRLWTRSGGTTEDVSTVVMWGVPAGIVGARLYHVATDWQLYADDPLRTFVIWDGGLGIWGGIAGGVLGGLFVARRRGLDGVALLSVAAPSLALAQAIGRIGNYFNQELFGRPTELPWALRIDAVNRPEGYEYVSTFHPTFLYESLWNLALCGVLLLVASRHTLRGGRLFLLYLAGYTAARFFIEGLRIDDAHIIGGLRLNEWTSLLVFIIAIGLLLRPARKVAA